jgi:hypothetical protein
MTPIRAIMHVRRPGASAEQQLAEWQAAVEARHLVALEDAAKNISRSFRSGRVAAG